MTRLTRRAALLTGAAALMAPAIAHAQSASRRFRLIRGSSDIGHHDIAVSRSGDTVEVAIDIAILVRVLGIPAYRYEMTNREVWQGGVLQSIRARTNDDGTAAFVTADRVGDAIRIEGSSHSGTVSLDVGTTTYWTPAFLNRSRWISTQGGTPLAIRAARAGQATFQTASGPVATTAWTLGPDLPATVHYTASGEWAGSTFDARGEQVRYLAEGLSPAFAPLWSET